MRAFFKFWFIGWLVVLGLAVAATILVTSFDFAGKHFGPFGQVFVCAFLIITATSVLFAIDYSKHFVIKGNSHMEL